MVMEMFKFEGEEQPTDLFENYSIEEVLVDCDRPLLFIMKSTKTEEDEDRRMYLFNWCCDITENGERFEKWMAFGASQERIDALMDGSITLREAILLYEDDFYIVDRDEENKIVAIISFNPVTLPNDFMPRPGITIYGPDEEWLIELRMGYVEHEE